MARVAPAKSRRGKRRGLSSTAAVLDRLSAGLSPEERRLLEAALAGRRRKFGNVKVEEDGHVFDSKAEHRRYRELRDLARLGAIEELVVHGPRFRFVVAGVLVGAYTPDFSYRERTAGDLSERRLVVEDVKAKATRTEAYGLRKKLMRACFQIEVREVEA